MAGDTGTDGAITMVGGEVVAITMVGGTITTGADPTNQLRGVAEPGGSSMRKLGVVKQIKKND